MINLNRTTLTGVSQGPGTVFRGVTGEPGTGPGPSDAVFREIESFNERVVFSNGASVDESGYDLTLTSPDGKVSQRQGHIDPDPSRITFSSEDWQQTISNDGDCTLSTYRNGKSVNLSFPADGTPAQAVESWSTYNAETKKQEKSSEPLAFSRDENTFHLTTSAGALEVTPVVPLEWLISG